jgi:hypothetical protein
VLTSAMFPRVRSFFLIFLFFLFGRTEPFGHGSLMVVNYGRVIYIYTLYVPSYSDVQRVYDVYQYIFSREGEYVLDVYHIFFQYIPTKKSFTFTDCCVFSLLVVYYESIKRELKTKPKYMSVSAKKD